MISPDELDIQNMKDLRKECNTFIHPTTYFDILCKLTVVFIGMWLDKEIVKKDRLRARIY